MISISYRPNSCQVNFTFHKNTSQAGGGNELIVDGGMQYMNIQFVTSDTFEAKVEAQTFDFVDIWCPYPSFKVPAYDLMETTISDKNYIYNIDLSAVAKIRINITSISGEVSVYGRVVS